MYKADRRRRGKAFEVYIYLYTLDQHDEFSGSSFINIKGVDHSSSITHPTSSNRQ